MTSSRVNISLPPELFAKAKQYNINISQAARDGIVAAIRREIEIEELLKSPVTRIGCNFNKTEQEETKNER